MLRKALGVCNRSADNERLRAVERPLLPIVVDFAGRRDVEFSLVRASVDLRDVRDGIWNLYEGRAKRADYYRVVSVFSLWRSDADGLKRVDGVGP